MGARVTIGVALAATASSAPAVRAALSGERTSAETLVGLGAKASGALWDLGEGWRLFSAHLPHVDPLHLVTNLFLLLTVGSRLEARLGARAMGAVYLAGALGCGWASALGSAGVGAGASGLVFALLGASFLEGPGAALALAGLVLSSVGGAGVDHLGHLGGFVAGAGVIVLRRLYGVRRTEWVVGALSVAAVGWFSLGMAWQERSFAGVSLMLPPNGSVRSCGAGCRLYRSAAGDEGLRVLVIDETRAGDALPAEGCEAGQCLRHVRVNGRYVVAAWPSWLPGYAARVESTFARLTKSVAP